MIIIKQLADHLKVLFAVLIVLVLGTLSAVRLMKIQVVGDEEIVNVTNSNDDTFSFSKVISPTRGEIVDLNGNHIIYNTTGNNVILEKAFFPEDNQMGNRVLLETYKILKNNGYEYMDTLPISKNTPYVFLPDSDDDVNELKKIISLNAYATAENCIDKFIDDYEISDEYTDSDKRIIAGLRYDLIVKDFAYSIDFVFAENIDTETLLEIKEKSSVLRGVNIVEAAVRNIAQGDIIPHEIGTIGPIYAEEYAELKNKGYALNDVVGKSGVELCMEETLRGSNGKKTITVSNNSIIDEKLTVAPTEGKTVKITIDSGYQKRLQDILVGFINGFPSLNKNPQLKNVKCGSIVVLDAKTGAVRGMATAPTYNLEDYKTNYEEILNSENSPLINRATDGLYRPGSTFKTITATAGLNEGLVLGDTTFYCNRNYTYIDTVVHCTGNHQHISVTKAIEVSCNIYFYELAQRLTIDGISDYATLYGLGQHTGIETGDAAGYLATPEEFERLNMDWYVGHVLQAGIGNAECGVTPLQMACVANTLANKGVRYKPYLIEGIYEYGTDICTAKTEPVIAEEIPLNYDYVYDYIEAGMIDASHNMPQKYSLSNLGFDVAIKTGTPQAGGSRVQDSFFIGYAPADNPEIAFAGVIEGGEYSKYMIRDIILAYHEHYGFTSVPVYNNATATTPSPEQTTSAQDSGTAPLITETATVNQ
ncbi:MAG: hypothetical protein J6A30_01980 [Ruminococcus sp.]|nr:hypothetical protein [Ruminococcus sp.]